MLSSLTPPAQQQPSARVSQRRRWITGSEISDLVLMMVIGSSFLINGNGTWNNPYRLSTGYPGVQHLGITLAAVEIFSDPQSATTAVCAIPTVVSLQMSNGQTQIHLSWQGGDSSHQYWWRVSDFGPESRPAFGGYSSTSILVDTLVYAAVPKAGQLWSLNLDLDDQSLGTACAYGAAPPYNTLFLQF